MGLPGKIFSPAAASARPVSCSQAQRPEKAQSAAAAAEPPAAPRTPERSPAQRSPLLAAVPPSSRAPGGGPVLVPPERGGPAAELSASLAFFAAAAAGALAAASCAPSPPGATAGLRTLAPDLLGGAPRSCPRPGWLSWLGLGAPGVNVHAGVCRDRIRGKKRLLRGLMKVDGGGQRRQERRWAQRGAGVERAAAPQSRAVRLEREKKSKRNGLSEEREDLSAREAGFEGWQVVFPVAQRSRVPPYAVGPREYKKERVLRPDSSVGRSSVETQDGAGLGSSLYPPQLESVLSGPAATRVTGRRVGLRNELVWGGGEESAGLGQGSCKGAGIQKIRAPLPAGAFQRHIPRPFGVGGPIARTSLMPATPTHPRWSLEVGISQ